MLQPDYCLSEEYIRVCDDAEGVETLCGHLHGAIRRNNLYKKKPCHNNSGKASLL